MTTITRQPAGAPASSGGQFKASARATTDAPLDFIYDRRLEPEASAYRYLVCALYAADPSSVADIYGMHRLDDALLNDAIDHDLDRHAQTDSLFGVSEAPALAFGDALAAWKSQSTPYVPIPTPRSQPFEELLAEDSAVDAAWVAERTYATGDPTKPYVTVELAVYPLAFEVGDDDSVTPLNGTRCDDIAVAALAGHARIEMADRIEAELARRPDKAATGPGRQAQAVATMLRDKAADDLARSARVKYAVCQRVTTRVHTDPAANWIPTKDEQVEYEDTSGAWIDTLESARRACENQVRHTDWAGDVTPRI